MIFAKSWIFAFFHNNYEKKRKSRILQKCQILADFEDFSNGKMNLFCDVDWICIDLHEFKVLWNLKFHAFSEILMIFAKSWIFAFFHMGEVKNWPPKNQPQDVGLEHFYNFLWALGARECARSARRACAQSLHFSHFPKKLQFSGNHFSVLSMDFWIFPSALIKIQSEII